MIRTLTIFLVAASVALGEVSVKDFHAAGDGVTPDQNAFQQAVNYMLEHGGGDIRVPSGTYLLGPQLVNSTYEVSVFVFCSPGEQIRFMGEPGATILTTNVMQGPGGADVFSLGFYVTGAADSVEFEHLNFVAVHPPEPASWIVAIMQGWDFGGVVTNLAVRHCSFRDWGTCISANCAETLTLQNNKFRYTRGRGEAHPGGEPACAVKTMFVDTVDSSGNDFLGSDILNYNGLAMNFLGPMDGYFNGYARRSSFIGDRIRRNAFEGILIQGRWWQDTNPPTHGGGMSGYAHLGQHVISDCLIDGDIRPGQTYLPWSGVSVLDSGATIQGCRIYDCKSGVYSQWEYPKPSGLGLTSLRVINNDIRMPSLKRCAKQYVASGGTFDQGVLVAGYSGVDVSGNRVYWPDRSEPSNATAGYLSGVALYASTNVTATGNLMVSDGVTNNPSAKWTLVGVGSYGGVQGLTTSANLFQNMDRALVSPLQPIQAQAKMVPTR